MSEASRQVEVTNKVGTMRASGSGQSGCDKAVMRTQQGPTVPPKRGADSVWAGIAFTAFLAGNRNNSHQVKMNDGSSVFVDKLVGNNYSYWKLCIEAYLQGQDLWDLISGDDVVIPEDTPQNAELRRKWKIKCGKALFALRTSISQEYIQHVRDGKLPNCSHHATGNASLLSEDRPYYGKRAIVTADNSLHPVVKERNFNVKKDISNAGGVSLKDVYHVPGLKKNLASVSQIADSRRYVLFGPDDVKIISNIKHLEADVLFTGKRKDSLYVLSTSDAYVEKTGQNASVTLWHARLGHVGYQLLQKISTKKLLDRALFKEIHQEVVCPGCQYGKSHRLPFPNSNNRATAAL
ncbi:hypothetical protein F0562_028079 [Nyssa sinensis]|uniref:GAG-pre-integrase domain-containing protein n=1 Tax=Nyssa sinensis TaxID=561372 RepID=A0A5J5B552_9ASTE|nr:hypothetical protein F0562_028079 [Nyssa sinensis]